MGAKLSKGFFARDSDVVAREFLGKVIVRRQKNGKVLKARIVESEAYFGENDPASWARFGKRNDNAVMWDAPGTILVKNVHKHFMLNFSTCSEGVAGAVLIRALEPLNFPLRCSGPGLLTAALKINKDFNGKNFSDELYIEGPDVDDVEFEIDSSKRVGVKNDLNENLRFYIKGNKFVSKVRWKKVR